MAAEIRTENPDVAGAAELSLALEKVRKNLFERPYEFEFFQAVRLLERLYPERAAIGRYAHPSEEVVRIAANPSVHFPASQIQALTAPDALLNRPVEAGAGGKFRFDRLGGDHEFAATDASVAKVLASRDRAVKMHVPSGMARTAPLQELRRGLIEGGREVLALGTTPSSVEDLLKMGFPRSVTVQRVLQDPEAQEETRGKVLIVDETEMVSRQQMLELVQLAEGQSARLVLTGSVDAAPSMLVNFIGLTGPLGALPSHLTELVANRQRAHDTALRDFFDLFTHRLASFFYQAWEKSHFTIGFERDQDDPLTNCLYGLVGLGTEGLRKRQPAVRDEFFIFFSGLFGLAPRSAVAIEAILGNFFNVPVEVEPFIGAWRKLEVQDQCELGDESETAASLGFGAVAGNEVWDQQSRVRLKFGPLSAKRYRDFLPTGSEWGALKALVRMYCGNDLEVEVQLILKREEVPATELGKLDAEGPQLGWYTWMKSKPEFDRNPDDTVLLLLEL
jgi:type VI secretion system protein ImpH